MEARKDVRSAVIGMVLGDGHLEVHGRHARFVSASIDEPYARYKADILSELTAVNVWHDGKIWRIRTKGHPLYTDLRRRFYHEGRKTVDRHLIASLDARALMLWYFDDGDLHVKELKANLSTHNFNEAEHEVLRSALLERFGLSWMILHKWHRERKLCFLRLKASHREAFFSLIQDAAQAIPSMAYKLPTAEGVQRIQRNALRLSESDVQALLPPQELLTMYADECLSIYAIAQQTGINSGTILGRLRRLGVAIRNAGKYAGRRYDLIPGANQGGDGNVRPSIENALLKVTA